MHLSPRTTGLIHSPIGSAYALLPQRRNERPLLDLSQAAPSFPPAPEVAARVAAVANEPDGARYAPQQGIPALIDAFAADLTLAYGTTVHPSEILITAGCNQAFCLAASALASPGDNIVLVSPFYFNHDMWLRVEGVEPRHLRVGSDGVPDVADLAALSDDRTRAVVLVSPGNPTGVTLSPSVIHTFADEARRLGMALIVDETYRTYRPSTEPAHSLFDAGDWGDHVVSLHSFSKDFAIPGYRVGAIVGGPPLLVEAKKLLDCVAICAPRIGQEAALAGLTQAGAWRRRQVERIGELQQRFTRVMADRPGGFELVTAGAYFGWIRHPAAALPAAEVVRRLVLDHDVLVIPGDAFTPTDEQMLRFSFANLVEDEIDELPARLIEFEATL